MNFAPCFLCDIRNGMLTPGGILIDNDRWFAVHAPPNACCKHLIVIGLKRHVLNVSGLARDELGELVGLQRIVDRALRDVSGLPSRVVSCPDRFGHLAWLAWADDGVATPIIERLAAVPEALVRAWADELETPIDIARIAAAGGRLPPPAPVPGDAERSTMRALAPNRFCTQCGNRLDPELLWEKKCPVCGTPVPE